MTLATSDDPKLRKLAEEVPPRMSAEGEEVSVVFVGTYSAGKSSLIKALTGREDIDIGAAITTDEVASYAWHGVRLWDTPGLHTGRESHDEVAYDAISRANLLVFVITSQLMDDFAATKFRELAIDQEKGREMMLVVNKMEKTASGNTSEQRKILREDLRRVLTPYAPEDLRICFTDAKAALEGSKEDLEESGLAELIEGLNGFVEDKALAGRLTSPLYELRRLLYGARAAVAFPESLGQGLEEVLLQKLRHLDEGRARATLAVSTGVQQLVRRIRAEGRDIADSIIEEPTPEDLKQSLAKAQERIRNEIEQLERSLVHELQAVRRDTRKEIRAIPESRGLGSVLNRLEQARLAEVASAKSKSKGPSSNYAVRLGVTLARWCEQSEAADTTALLGFDLFGDLEAQSTVAAAADFFGVELTADQVWDVVEWIGGLGTIIAIGGVLAGIAADLSDRATARRRTESLRQLRVHVRRRFLDFADKIEEEFLGAAERWVERIFEAEIAQVDRRLTDLHAVHTDSDELDATLTALLYSTQDLIHKCHRAGP